MSDIEVEILRLLEGTNLQDSVPCARHCLPLSCM